MCIKYPQSPKIWTSTSSIFQNLSIDLNHPIIRFHVWIEIQSSTSLMRVSKASRPKESRPSSPTKAYACDVFGKHAQKLIWFWHVFDICISNQKCNLILDFHAIWFEHAVFFSVGLPRLWKVLLPKPELGGEVGKVAFTTTASHRSTDRLELVRTPRQLWSSKLSGHCSLAMLNI